MTGSRSVAAEFLATLSTVCAFLCIGCGMTASDDAEFSFVGVDMTGYELRSGSSPALTELVDGLTEGQVSVSFESAAAHCVDSAGCLQALQAGELDIARVKLDDIATLFPELQVLEVPYLIESARVAELVFTGTFFSRMRDAILDRTGLRLMAVSNIGGWRHIANDVRELRAPEDLEGLKFQTANVPVHIETTRALGASPAGVSGDTLILNDLAVEPSQGLRTGIIDLLKRVPETRPTFLTVDRHAYIIGFWLMNERSYRLMPLDLQQIVQLGFDELRRITLSFPDNREAAALDVFRADGGQVYVPTADEQRAFVTAAGRVSTWFMDAYGYEWLVWLEGAIAEAERELSASSRQ